MLQLTSNAGGKTNIISRTLAPVVLTIGVPDQFQAWNNFQVISIVNGSIEVLPDLDVDPRTVTVATNKILAYWRWFIKYSWTPYIERCAGRLPGGDSGSFFRLSQPAWQTGFYKKFPFSIDIECMFRYNREHGFTEEARMEK